MLILLFLYNWLYLSKCICIFVKKIEIIKNKD